MNKEWDLSIMYKGFDDPLFNNDFEKLKSLIEDFKKFCNSFTYDKKEVITTYLKKEEQIVYLVNDLYTYSSLRTTTNVNDKDALSNCSKLQMLLNDLVLPEVQFKKYLKNVDLTSINDSYIKEHEYILSNLQKESQHMLSDKEEVLASKLSMVSSSSWSDLQSKLTSNLAVKVYGIKGKMPLSSVRALAYDKDKNVRYHAYKAELKAYKQIEDSVAMALNNIKREVNIMMPLRGYNNILEMTLEQSHVSKKALDAMIDAIKEKLPEFRRYYKLKAKYLGYKNGLPFYELFAPMGSLNVSYSIDEAKALVLDVYKSFSDELYNLGKTAFEESWIDFYPHDGKVGGAFDCGISNHKVSRVLTNFTGSLGDVQTLAHELGHAYHDHVIFNNSILNQNYPMPLAETASILCETLMSQKLINDIKDKNEKITVVENSIQGDTQCVVDILSRYLFESMVCDSDVSTVLSSDDMCQMMIKAQKESYGDGLDPKYLHPYMWLCKSHYYSAGYNFYNWPYAFGLLYARGLYSLYLKDKKSFVKKYDEMLKNTCLMSATDVAHSMGIDIETKEFWLSSLDTIVKDIDLFEELLGE